MFELHTSRFVESGFESLCARCQRTTVCESCLVLRGRNIDTSNEYQGGRKKIFCRRFSTWLQNHKHKYCTNIPLNMSRVGGSLKDNGKSFFLSSIYSHTQTTGLEVEILEDVWCVKFFDVISVGNLPICSLSLSSLCVVGKCYVYVR
jgi:hypothetical protein